MEGKKGTRKETPGLSWNASNEELSSCVQVASSHMGSIAKWAEMPGLVVLIRSCRNWANKEKHKCASILRVKFEWRERRNEKKARGKEMLFVHRQRTTQGCRSRNSNPSSRPESECYRGPQLPGMPLRESRTCTSKSAIEFGTRVALRSPEMGRQGRVKEIYCTQKDPIGLG